MHRWKFIKLQTFNYLNSYASISTGTLNSVFTVFANFESNNMCLVFRMSCLHASTMALIIHDALLLVTYHVLMQTCPKSPKTQLFNS